MTFIVLSSIAKIFISVIGTVVCAVPETWLSLVLLGTKVVALVPIQPLAKLFVKKAFACVTAAVFSVVPVPVMYLRPASTPASHACCSRTFTTYSRAASTAEPASAVIGSSIAAMIAIVLPRLSRRSRRSRVKVLSVIAISPPCRPGSRVSA